MKWIPIEKAKPLLTHGEQGRAPILSDDVLVFFGAPDGDGTIAIASYDAEEDCWDVRTGFHEYSPAIPDPTHWMPLPEAPTNPNPSGQTTTEASRLQGSEASGPVGLGPHELLNQGGV